MGGYQAGLHPLGRVGHTHNKCEITHRQTVSERGSEREKEREREIKREREREREKEGGREGGKERELTKRLLV